MLTHIGLAMLGVSFGYFAGDGIRRLDTTGARWFGYVSITVVVWMFSAIFVRAAFDFIVNPFGSAFIGGLVIGANRLRLASLRSITKPSPATSSAKKCPFCAEIIKAEAVVCRYCKRDLPKAESTSAE